MRRKLFVAIVTLMLAASSAAALHRRGRSQSQTKTLAERLGYPRDAKLLIVHADDLGAAHSINSAVTADRKRYFITMNVERSHRRIWDGVSQRAI